MGDISPCRLVDYYPYSIIIVYEIVDWVSVKNAAQTDLVEASHSVLLAGWITTVFEKSKRRDLVHQLTGLFRFKYGRGDSYLNPYPFTHNPWSGSLTGHTSGHPAPLWCRRNRTLCSVRPVRHVWEANRSLFPNCRQSPETPFGISVQIFPSSAQE